MATLNSIELSNIRRFSSNVRIDIGPGATILIAPNGTGKTAIFEAIELALTGNIHRLGNSYIPIIKDGFKTASVKLNFDGWSREISVSKAGVLEIDPGRLDKLFPGVDPSYYPYLLRLTHLLDQRGKQWFVQGDSANAGEQLSRLPLGREAVQILQKMMPIKRALTQEKNNTAKQLEASSISLQRLEKLQAERLQALSSVRPLISLENILLNVGIKQYDLTGEIPADLSFMKEQIGSLTRVESKNLEELTKAFSQLEEFEPLLSRYHDLLAQKADRENNIQSTSTAIDQSKKEIEIIDRKIASSEISLKGMVANYNFASEIQQKRMELEAELAKTSGHAKVIQELNSLKLSNQNLLATEKNKYNLLKNIEDRHIYVSRVAATHTEEGLEISAALQSLEIWKESQKEFDELSNLVQQLQLSIIDVDTTLESLGYQVDVLTGRLDVAKDQLASLSDTENKLRAALAQISTCLDPKSDDCPVCHSHVGAAHIRISLDSAIQAVTPQYLTAAHNVDTLRTELTSKQSELQTNKENRGIISQKLHNALQLKAVIQARIDECCSNKLLQGHSVSAAAELLASAMNKLALKKKNLELERNDIPPAVDQLSIQFAINEIQRLELEGDQINSRLRELESQSKILEDNIQGLQAYLSGIEETEDATTLDGKRRALSATIIDNSESRKILSIKQDDEERNLQLQIDGLIEDDAAINKILSSWMNLDIEGDPNPNLIDLKRLNLTERIDSSRRKLRTLENSEEEIARWSIHVEHDKIQQEIDSMRGQFSELEYGNTIRAQISETETKLENIERTRLALDDFSTKLSEEIDGIQKKISMVVPLWRTLLNRIVREPRFGKTDLRYYSERNKAKAEIHVNLGEHEVSVASIASEAQMTDIQLSFLLSMSLTHAWSPWKALLLDDPTQHHDLVHASAVFDLLRDFISDHGYQVVIATHDAAQARYFLRKLLNDGVEARIINLHPSEGGVTVKSGGSTQVSDSTRAD